jgi:transposase
MMDITCKKCGSAQYIKYGFIREEQRYKCIECKCQFTLTKYRGVHPALKGFAIVLYAYCGVSMNKIAKMFKVSTVAVLKWVRGAALKTTAPIPVTDSNIVMIDEVWHFVNGKKTKYGFGEPLMGYRVELSDGNWAIVAIPQLKS